jgi:hypothetical protein
VYSTTQLRKRRDVFLPVGPAMRRVSGHLMGIWKNKPSVMVDANEIGQWIERDRIKKH